MKAIILFSGGVDSTVCLAYAIAEGRECIALSFDYGQRHKIELESARKIAAAYDIPHIILKLPSWGAESVSALLNDGPIPKNRTMDDIVNQGVAPTYVPARNTLFLSYALAVAEVQNAFEIYIGSNADDCIPYPDCRPAFFKAFQSVAEYATKQAIENSPPRIITPLIGLRKPEIIQLGKKLEAPLELTFSCYAPSKEDKACGRCDACMLRQF